MKKYIANITGVTIMVVSMVAQAQTLVPNAGMEAWHTILFYEEPDNWNTLNAITIFDGNESVTKDTGALDGVYAARLEAYASSFGVNVPGGMGTGTLDFQTQNFTGGFPLSGSHPEAVIGYYKYAPVGGDSCLVGAALFRWDTVNDQRDTIAIAYFIGGPASAYTLFSAPFVTLMPGIPPDSAIVVVSTASDLLNANVGSVMYLDDIDFTNTVGLYEIPQSVLQFFPSPADQTLQILIPPGKASTLLITGTDGKIVNEIPNAHLSSELKINTSSLPQGVYVAYLKSTAGKIMASGKFTVKH